MFGVDIVAVRYLMNGAVATGLHFLTLWMCIDFFHFASAGIANFIAALVASTAAFFGNRYFVFTQSMRSPIQQAKGFVILYLAAALFHGLFLHVWSDRLQMHYATGFVLATALQVVGIYVFNRKVVFA